MTRQEIVGQIKAGFFKVLPAISTMLVYRGAITQEQGAALVSNAQVAVDWALIVVGALGYVWTAIYSWWANRSAKKVADVAAMPGVDVSAPPALAASATAAAAPEAKSSITAKAA